MKILRKLLLVGVSLFTLAFVPTGPTTVTVFWDKQGNTDLFKVYQSPDISIPLTNWTVITNTAGTNNSITFAMAPQQMWFFVTASNFWGESGPSNMVNTPPIANTVTNAGIRKGP